MASLENMALLFKTCERKKKSGGIFFMLKAAFSLDGGVVASWKIIVLPQSLICKNSLNFTNGSLG